MVNREKRCLRCGRAFSNPVPEVTHPEGIHEIATHEWCTDCNIFAMNILFRWSSAYRVRSPYDPLRGGSNASS